MKQTLAALCLALLLTGCMMPEKAITGAARDEALSFMRVSTSINGKKTAGLSFCRLTFKHDGKGDDLGLRYTDNSDWTVIKSPSGLVTVETLDCLQYRVLYNKITSHKFTAKPSFHAASGVTYVGDIDIAFRPKKFNGADVGSLLLAPIITIPSITDDKTLVTMGVTDNYAEAKEDFLKRYAKNGQAYTFHKSLMNLPKQ